MNSDCTNCSMSPMGPLCVCLPGLQLGPDNKTCIGKENSGCTNCSMSPIGPLCVCLSGLQLGPDNKTCIGKVSFIFC